MLEPLSLNALRLMLPSTKGGFHDNHNKPEEGSIDAYTQPQSARVTTCFAGSVVADLRPWDPRTGAASQNPPSRFEVRVLLANEYSAKY